MRVWLGHYSENPKEWFIVWDYCVENAWDDVDQVGSVETTSFREIVSPGIANFHSSYNNSEESETISLAKDKTRRERWLVLGDQSLLQNPNDYIAALNSERVGNQKLGMKIWRGSYLLEGQKKGEDCFVVWAKTKDEALQIVEQTFGSVDKDSLTEIKNGFIDFHVDMKVGTIVFTPPKDDIEKTASGSTYTA